MKRKVDGFNSFYDLLNLSSLYIKVNLRLSPATANSEKTTKYNLMKIDCNAIFPNSRREI